MPHSRAIGTTTNLLHYFPATFLKRGELWGETRGCGGWRANVGGDLVGLQLGPRRVLWRVLQLHRVLRRGGCR